MNALIVYAHEELKSFNGALKNTAVRVLRDAGHSVEVSDLVAMNFNPVGGSHDFTKLSDPKLLQVRSRAGKGDRGQDVRSRCRR